MDLDILEFLKYGAIGIALALAGLSYKLLSKEQEQDEVRPAMLKTIKVFFLMAIVLSALFAGAEVFTSVNGKGETTAHLDELYEKYLNSPADSITAAQKKKSLAGYIDGLNDKNLNYARQIAEDEENMQYGDFYRYISALSSQVARFGNSINLQYEPETKQEVFDALNSIFMHLELCNARIESSGAVADEWVRLKSSWTDSGQQYIKNSDISSLVQRYLRLERSGDRPSAFRRPGTSDNQTPS